MQANGPNIRSRREQLGHGLNAFARQVGISPSHLSRIERGLRGAQPEVLWRIAHGLHLEGVTAITREETERKS
ncbi:helix-turn-helix domain-containing protein [Kitasatospora sp. NPDC058201]|uniref:helix-turn-helix domain-containing protein n=1 Tax=unclassified Kitasatospora TaxID=2633591 RepID=UPI003650944E